MKRAVTPKQFDKFRIDFYKDPFNSKKRFGQSFCNTFNITDPTIFYEQNYFVANTAIYDKYIVSKCIICGAKDYKEYDLLCTGECETEQV